MLILKSYYACLCQLLVKYIVKFYICDVIVSDENILSIKTISLNASYYSSAQSSKFN